MCIKCEKYFEKYTCGANTGSGECDCPKCQGLCTDNTSMTNYTIKIMNETFKSVNQIIHPVQKQWHYPIMTKYGYVADTKEDTDFVRKYDYHNPITGHKMSVHTGANADYFCDDYNPVKDYLWAGLEPHLKSLSKEG
jgi:hypothetical protein